MDASRPSRGKEIIMTTQESLILNEAAGKPSAAKKRYTKPCLKHYGSLRSQTLGPTLGSNESGFPTTRQVRFGQSPVRKSSAR
jgi:hypothetical protein